MFTGVLAIALPPGLVWTAPFIAMLLAIAILPLVHRTAHWWEHNRNKLLVAVALSLVTLGYYYFRPYGIEAHHANAKETSHAETAQSEPDATADAAHGPPGGHLTAPGLATVLEVLNHAIVVEYVPFIVLLFSLYVISGGILVAGDIRATPFVNTTVLGLGAILASLIGTTGASMVLIRFLLRTNSERKYRVHTVVFFIFVVSNCGGLLLPTGDPPLFLGYLMGVPFFWTAQLWRHWLFVNATLLALFFIWDTWAYTREPAARILMDVERVEPMRISGTINFLWLVLVVTAVATLDASKVFPGTSWKPLPYLREAVQLALVGLSLLTTPRGLRGANGFNYTAIGEVACLFVGIFITMQVPIEILRTYGSMLGLTQPWHFFWASGLLSSFLDNAPTYVVYFTSAGTLHPPGMHYLHGVQTASGDIAIELLIAISCGSVFMGANTYIGNGPNFMVKSIAESYGVKMPSFFGYMLYSLGILIPLFIVMTFVFFTPATAG